MTYDEWADPVANTDSRNPTARQIWEAATAAERERIAMLSEEVDANYPRSEPSERGRVEWSEQFADLIRGGN